MAPALLPDVIPDGAVARDDEGEGGVADGGGGAGGVALAGGDAAPEVGHVVGEGGQVEDGGEVGEGGAEEQQLLPESERADVVLDHLREDVNVELILFD